MIDLDDLRALYPHEAGRVRHTLADHPAFTLEALAELAARLPAAQVEYNRGDLPVGIVPEAVPGNGLSAGDTVRGIETNGSWMVIKHVERDAAYAALLDLLLDGIAPVVAPATGPLLRREAFVFVSSPGSVTPFHFDPEHNLLLQLRGTKTMTVFPHADREIAPATEHERFHAGGHRNLPWDERWRGRGVAISLAPGQAVHVPLMAPHWVANGPAVSISFSVTWRSGWAFVQADAHMANRHLRRLGLHPAPPQPHDAVTTAKAIGRRALRRLGVD